jgi:hypothetical protein
LKDYRHKVPWATTRTSFVDFNNAYEAIDSHGRTIWIADAHRGDGNRFVVHADEKLSAFVELKRVSRESLRFPNVERSAQFFPHHEVNRA